MKKIILPFLAIAVFGCSSDDDNASNNNQVKTAEDVAGNWRLIGRYDSGSSVNSATSCNLELSTLFFGDDHFVNKVTGNTNDDEVTCHTITSQFDEYWVLPGIVRLEQNSYTKQVYAADLVDGNLHLTQTSYLNADGSHPIPTEEQETFVYEAE